MQGSFGHTEASMDIQRYSDVSELRSTLMVFVDFPHWDYNSPYLCIERASRQAFLIHCGVEND